MTVRFRVDARKGAIKPVECAVAGWPNVDADGVCQYENTHFDTEAEARDTLFAELEAGVELAAVAREEAQEQLRRRTEELVDRAQALGLARSVLGGTAGRTAVPEGAAPAGGRTAVRRGARARKGRA